MLLYVLTTTSKNCTVSDQCFTIFCKANCQSVKGALLMILSLILICFFFRIEDTHRSWKKFLIDFSSFSDWLITCEATAKEPLSNNIMYEDARKQLKIFEVTTWIKS